MYPLLWCQARPPPPPPAIEFGGVMEVQMGLLCISCLCCTLNALHPFIVDWYHQQLDINTPGTQGL